MSHPRAPALLSALLAFALAGCPGGDRSPPDAGVSQRASAARLESTRGEVTLERAGAATRATLGYLFPGDALETGSAGEAKVRFTGGRLLELGSDARFELSEGEGGVVLELSRGLVLLSGTGTGADAVSLTVRTPYGTSELGKGGNEVSFEVGDGGTNVDVRLGQIAMVGEGGVRTTLSLGKITLGAAPKAAPVPLTLAAIQLTIVVGGGRTELQRKDTKAWVLVGKKPAAFQPGDSVRVREGRSTLVAAGSGSQVTLLKGAEVTLGSASQEGDAEETALQLARGPLAAVLARDRKSRLKLGELTLTAEKGAQLEVVKTQAGYELTALTGDLTLERPGEAATRIEGGDGARIPNKGAVARVEGVREAVVLPSHLGMRVLHTGLPRVALAWEGDERKPYEVEVAADAQFKAPLLAGVVHQRFVNVAAPQRGALFWRVKDGAAEVAKGSAVFGPEPKDASLERPKNEVPEGTEKTTIYFQDKPPSVTFLYAEEPEATRYRVLVYRSDALDKPVADRTGTGTALALPEGALVEGSYVWSVAALNAKGATVRESAKLNKLDLVYDNAVPNLIIKAPRNGEAAGAQAQVSGIAPLGSKVTVNGKPLTLDAKSRFDMSVAPLGGGRLVFRMLFGGNEIYTVRSLRRGR